MRMITRGTLTPLAMLVLAACSTVGQVRNLDATACAAGFDAALGAILADQGEAPEDAAALAARTRATLASQRLGPRPFAIAAPSGTDYYLFVEPEQPACQLRLYGRVHGFTRYTNNLTWIDSRPLPACECAP